MPATYGPKTAVVQYQENGLWVLKAGGITKMSSERKRDLVSNARNWAQSSNVEWTLVIERKNGTVQDRVEYDAADGGIVGNIL